VRLRIERRHAHRVARVAFRLVEGMPAEKRERERLGGREVVRGEPDDAAKQRLARRRLAFACANFLQQGERAQMQRRAVQDLNEEPRARSPFCAAARAFWTSSDGAVGGQDAAQSRAQQRPALRPLPQAQSGRSSVGDGEVMTRTLPAGGGAARGICEAIRRHESLTRNA
jgi:hypothetical protein